MVPTAYIGEQQYFIARVRTGLTNLDEGVLTLKTLSEGLSFPALSKYHALFKTVSGI
jgi:hypothetical protein